MNFICFQTFSPIDHINHDHRGYVQIELAELPNNSYQSVTTTFSEEDLSDVVCESVITTIVGEDELAVNSIPNTA